MLNLVSLRVMAENVVTDRQTHLRTMSFHSTGAAAASEDVFHMNINMGYGVMGHSGSAQTSTPTDVV